jgi:hypothetical protein
VLGFGFWVLIKTESPEEAFKNGLFILDMAQDERMNLLGASEFSVHAELVEASHC